MSMPSYEPQMNLGGMPMLSKSKFAGEKSLLAPPGINIQALDDHQSTGNKL